MAIASRRLQLLQIRITTQRYYDDNNSANAVHVGPPSTLTGGFGNFTNGMWFSVLKPMTIDSISVISNGLVNFKFAFLPRAVTRDYG